MKQIHRLSFWDELPVDMQSIRPNPHLEAHLEGHHEGILPHLIPQNPVNSNTSHNIYCLCANGPSLSRAH